MKKNLIIFLMGAALIFSGCESKKAEKSETLVKPLTSAERSAKVTKERAEMESQRQIALAKLVSNTPFYENTKGIQIYYKAETDPFYIGGNAALEKFLNANLKYPEAAEKEGLEGTVFVDFVVSEKGIVSEAKATSYTFGEPNVMFKNEALRVVNLMPAWSPGMQNGKAVAVKFSVPITFTIRS